MAKSGDGRSVNSAKALIELLENASGGETVLLRGGDFGELRLENLSFDPPVRLASETPEKPARFSRIRLTDVQNLEFSGIEICQTPHPETMAYTTAVEITRGGGVAIVDSSLQGGAAINGVDPDSAAGFDRSMHVRGLPAGRALFATHVDGLELAGVEISTFAKGVVVMASERLRLRDCVFQDLMGAPVAASNVSDAVVEGNKIGDLRPWPADGSAAGDAIQFKCAARGRKAPCDGISIMRNHIRPGGGARNRAIVLACDPGAPGFRDLAIENNLIETSTAAGVYCEGGVGGVVRNNTMLGDDQAAPQAPGLLLTADCQDLLIENNMSAGVWQDGAPTPQSPPETTETTNVQIVRQCEEPPPPTLPADRLSAVGFGADLTLFDAEVPNLDAHLAPDQAGFERIRLECDGLSIPEAHQAAYGPAATEPEEEPAVAPEPILDLVDPLPAPEPEPVAALPLKEELPPEASPAPAAAEAATPPPEESPAKEAPAAERKSYGFAAALASYIERSQKRGGDAAATADADRPVEPTPPAPAQSAITSKPEAPKVDSVRRAAMAADASAMDAAAAYFETIPEPQPVETTAVVREADAATLRRIAETAADLDAAAAYFETIPKPQPAAAPAVAREADAATLRWIAETAADMDAAAAYFETIPEPQPVETTAVAREADAATLRRIAETAADVEAAAAYFETIPEPQPVETPAVAREADAATLRRIAETAADMDAAAAYFETIPEPSVSRPERASDADVMNVFLAERPDVTVDLGLPETPDAIDDPFVEAAETPPYAPDPDGTPSDPFAEPSANMFDVFDAAVAEAKKAPAPPPPAAKDRPQTRAPAPNQRRRPELLTGDADFFMFAPPSLPAEPPPVTPAEPPPPPPAPMAPEETVRLPAKRATGPPPAIIRPMLGAGRRPRAPRGAMFRMELQPRRAAAQRRRQTPERSGPHRPGALPPEPATCA